MEVCYLLNVAVRVLVYVQHYSKLFVETLEISTEKLFKEFSYICQNRTVAILVIVVNNYRGVYTVANLNHWGTTELFNKHTL